ncbi:asparagine synthase (glutamine-hydrolyzing), partial [bacterium]|nr:asparagine synthase (glutamine-hydrolyzing) [bacterium]
MCGFAGYFSKTTEVSESICHKMIDSLRHRGPDDSGVWVDSASGIALGHRRLSIQDLSPLGYQPMHSASGRYVVAFNGEIYNFKTLKQQLERLDYYFTGHSDTEVLLAAVDVWGLEKALSSFVGMFAFSLWDRRERILTLARDRIGEKPLYYGWQGKAFLFGSELKALRMHQDWVGSINRAALALQMRHSYIPAPHSIYQGIQKLSPGTFIQISHDISQGVTPEPYSYWSMREVAGSGKQHDFDYNDQQAVSALNSLLGETIQEKMVADVPLGAFLSGGVDSSTVVAIMQAHSSRPVKTFSIGFHEKEYSEAKHAKEVAKYLKTDHTELYVTPEQAMAVIPKLPSLYDEPFS